MRKQYNTKLSKKIYRGDTALFLDSIFASSLPQKLDGSGNEKAQGLDFLASLLKTDQLPFRRNMTWFVQGSKAIEQAVNFESINSPECLKLLWPKGAELMF